MSADVYGCWSEADFCQTVPADTLGQRLDEVAAATYERVCRTDFAAPGFCLVNLGESASSQALRGWMVALKGCLQQLHTQRRGRELVVLSAGRFDQQVTTKPHRDGGPEECLLLLGYEPSAVPSELCMADYARCAHEMGLTPAEFLNRHNPMFAAGERLLERYTTRVSCFWPAQYQVVCINNSMAPYSPAPPAWQGVLHTARIADPNPSRRRIVNSLMVASVPLGAPDPVSSEELAEFVKTTKLRRRGYDRSDLEDDD